MGDAASAAQSAHQQNINSVGQLVGAAAPAAALALIYFTGTLLLRRKLPDIYDPKRQRLWLIRDSEGRPKKGAPLDFGGASWYSVADGAPPDPPLLVCTWGTFLWRMRDEMLLKYLGTDAYMFLRYLRAGVKLFFVLSILGLGVLLPINIIAGGSQSQLEALSLSNVPARSRYLWAHFAATYVFSLFALHLLYKEYQVFADLRQRYLRSPTPQSYSLLIRDIPKHMRSTSKLTFYLSRLLGDSVLAVHPVAPPGTMAKYEKLVQKRDQAIIQLDRALEAERMQHKRPAVRLWCDLRRCCGRVDAVDKWTTDVEKYNREIAAIRAERDDHSGSAAIVTFDAIRPASTFRGAPIQQKIGCLDVRHAPSPPDLLWRNISTPSLVRTVRKLLVWVAVIALIIGYAIPVGFVASLANLEEISRHKHMHWIKPIVDVSPTLTSFISGFLPPLVLSIFFSLVPSIMKFLTKQEATISDSDAENDAILKVYLFNLLDVFLAYTLAGTFASQISQFVDLASHPPEVVSILARSLPSQSTFFLTYIILGALSGLPSELFRLTTLIIVKLRKCTSRHRSIWDDLQILTTVKGFHQLYAFPLVAFLVGMCYAVLAPIILPCALLYFLMAYMIWSHQLLYIYQPTTHTGASHWLVVFKCCIVSLVVAELLMIGILGLKEMPIACPCLVPLLLFTIYCGFKWHRDFNRIGEAATLENLLHADAPALDTFTRNAVAEAYTPLPIMGINQELSTGRFTMLTDPYGLIYTGAVTYEQKEATKHVVLQPTGVVHEFDATGTHLQVQTHNKHDHEDRKHIHGPGTHDSESKEEVESEWRGTPDPIAQP